MVYSNCILYISRSSVAAAAGGEDSMLFFLVMVAAKMDAAKHVFCLQYFFIATATSSMMYECTVYE